MKRCLLLAMKDMRGKNGGGEVNYSITTGESWQCSAIVRWAFQVADKMDVLGGGR